ncbi:hypothetical protein ACOMHN_033294 [Nucella lapillus]
MTLDLYRACMSQERATVTHILQNHAWGRQLLSSPSDGLINNLVFTEYHNTLLHAACSVGNLDLVEYLLSIGGNINVRNKNGHTPLHLACFQGHQDLVESLVQRHKADMFARTRQNFTPRHIAIMKHHDSIVAKLQEVNEVIPEELLNAGSDSITDDSKSMKTVLRDLFGTRWRFSNLQKGVDILREILSLRNPYAVLTRMKDNYPTGGNYLLLETLVRAHRQFRPQEYLVLFQFLELEKQMVATMGYKCGRKEQLLHLAVRLGHTDIVHVLVTHGTSVNVPALGSLGDGHKIHAQFTACEMGHYKITRLLMKEGANVHARNIKRQTVLHVAAQRGFRAMMKFLINGCSARTIHDYTPLHYTAFRGDAEGTRLLLEYGSSIFVRSDLGESPKMLARRMNHHEVVRMIEREIRVINRWQKRVARELQQQTTTGE